MRSGEGTQETDQGKEGEVEKESRSLPLDKIREGTPSGSGQPKTTAEQVGALAGTILDELSDTGKNRARIESQKEITERNKRQRETDEADEEAESRKRLKSDPVEADREENKATLSVDEEALQRDMGTLTHQPSVGHYPERNKRQLETVEEEEEAESRKRPKSDPGFEIVHSPIESDNDEKEEDNRESLIVGDRTERANDTPEKRLERNKTGVEKLESGACTLAKGETNEDAFFVDDKRGIGGVFDGLGGLEDGHLASKTASEFAHKELDKLSNDLSIEGLTKEMREILIEAHDAILKIDPSSNMGTTALIIKIVNKEIIAVNAGDCRAYIFRSENKSLECLTLDNVTSDDLDSKEKKEIEALWDMQEAIADLETLEGASGELQEAFKKRKYVFNRLGRTQWGKEIDPAIYRSQLKSGDKIILTSDGIHDNLTKRQIADCVSENSWNAQESAKALVDEAKQISDLGRKSNPRSKKDDMTAIVIHVK